jgi:prolycopene isomerase
MEELTMSNQALRSAYDVIVIGAGLGGLTTGALLAKAGKQVLVVEKEQHPGGFIREFRHGPYIINPAIHSIMGCNPAGPLGQGVIDAVLEHLGVQDQCQFIRVDPFYRAQFPDFRMDVPLGRDAFLDAYLHHFPGDAEGLRSLVDLCSASFQEAMQFPAVPRWQDWLLMPFRSPKIFRNATSTLAAVLDRYLSDSRLKSVYAVLYPYLALPPSRLSFFLWSIMMASYIEQGAYYCQGGFQNIAAAFAEGVTKHGGELILEMPVKNIRVAGGKVQGIELQNGQEVDAPAVISNIDVRTTFQDLIEADQVPTSYLRKINDLEPSASVLGLFLATDLDVQALGIPKVTLLSSWDLEDAYTAALHGNPKSAAVHVPTVIDDTLAPPGEHLVIIQSFIPAESARLSPSASAAYAESLLDLAEQVLPDLREHITFMVGASEEEQQKYPLQRLGPIYGWANSVGQAGPRRLPYKTPVSGLYLAGHWTQPGSGVWTVVLSGVNAARYAIGKDMSQAIWPLDL